MRKDWVGNATVKHEFDRFTAEVSDLLLRTGYLMTGNAKDAEDLAQETLLRVARRWKRVRSMERPAAYARRILINLVLAESDRQSRQRAELQPGHGAFEASEPRRRTSSAGRRGRSPEPPPERRPGWRRPLPAVSRPPPTT
jgi:DNA-directed RNA polymerase specialized sigma24 family protein